MNSIFQIQAESGVPCSDVFFLDLQITMQLGICIFFTFKWHIELRKLIYCRDATDYLVSKKEKKE